MHDVTVRYYCEVEERLGYRAEVLRLPERITVRELLRRVASRHPGNDRFLARCRILRAHAVGRGVMDLSDDTVLAVVPPVDDN